MGRQRKARRIEFAESTDKIREKIGAERWWSSRVSFVNPEHLVICLPMRPKSVISWER
jgi:hypothetical protein